MKRITGVMTAACLAMAVAVSAQTGELTDGKEILSRSAKACKAVKTVRYNAVYTSTGWVKPYVADVKGMAIVGGQSKWEVSEFYCEVELKKGEEEAKTYAAGCDGDIYFLVDHKTKTVHVDMDPAVMGSSARDIQRIVEESFSAKEPFKDSLEASTIELEGTATIDGELCYEVRVKPDDGTVLTFSISKRDFLPRKVLRVHANRQDPEGEPGTTVLTLTNLTVDPKLKRNQFKAPSLKGYKKSEEFAP